MQHDLVAHLYAAALLLMREHGAVFVPLEVVSARLDWSPEQLGAVVDHCVAADPVAAGTLRAEWMHEGGRPAFGHSAAQFIGIRPAVPSGADLSA